MKRSVSSLLLSLVSFLLGLYFVNQPHFYISAILFAVSICAVTWSLVIFWNSIQIIIEASSAVQQIRRMAEEKTSELLRTLVDNSKSSDKAMFVDPKNIRILFNGEEITNNREYVFSVNKEHSIKIELANLSEYMIKTSELGFTFPEEILIADALNVATIFTGEKEKIVRFRQEKLQARTNLHEGHITLTFLKIGEFDVDAFVKGENVKNKTVKFKIKVIE